MTKKIEYHSGKLGAMVKYILSMVKKDPSLVDNFDRVRTNLYLAVPELSDKSKCANCGASMKEYTYFFDAWDANLLIAMARMVRDNIRSRNLTFTQANQIMVPELGVRHSVKCRTTKASKLGLVVELRSTATKRRVPGVWVITRRGWDALRGERVPSKVRVWRKLIEERFEETVTIAEVFATQKKSKRKSETEMERYDSKEWFDFGTHEGKIF